MSRRITREDAVDILRAHMRCKLPVEPSVLERIMSALDNTKVERGTITSVGLRLNCCDVAEKARAFLAGHPVSTTDVLSMAALILTNHQVTKGGQHVA